MTLVWQAIQSLLNILAVEKECTGFPLKMNWHVTVYVKDNQIVCGCRVLLCKSDLITSMLRFQKCCETYSILK